MLKCRFIIVAFFHFLFSESTAEFWCAENQLVSLIECLLDTNIKNPVPWTYDKIEEFQRRFECAKDADCTPKPWEIFRPKIQTLRNFVECMDDIPTLPEDLKSVGNVGTSYAIREYRCRKTLTYSLPFDLIRLYHMKLLPPNTL